MDARDRLRRYLEQRRELGESEFLLDGLPVEDALRMLGARGKLAPRAKGDSPASTRADRESDVPERPVAPDYSYDAPPPERAPSVQAPPEPAPRFAAGTTTDWREALRNAGAAKPGEKASAPSSTPNPSSAQAPAVGESGVTVPAGTAPTLTPPSSNGSTASLPAWLAALGIPPGLASGSLRTSDMAPHVAALPTLDNIAEHVAACTSCALHKSAKHSVPGEGDPRAEVLCVGEAPGAHEDEQGRPFVGEAGQLLTKILGAIQLGRDDVYICNVLKHRPPGNRDPLPDEVVACQPYLLRQIELVQPRVIVALGRFAAQTLLQTTAGIGMLRGKVHEYHGVPLIVTYHPAALLRNEQWKRPTWEDVKLARRILDASRAAIRGTE
ncbi:uracil-DNA glycosylase [Gemmatimonas sp.]